MERYYRYYLDLVFCGAVLAGIIIIIKGIIIIAEWLSGVFGR